MLQYCRASGISAAKWETMGERLEYAAVWTILKSFGALPRWAARSLAAPIARISSCAAAQAAENGGVQSDAWPFRIGTDAQREAAIRGMVRNLGWMAAEFARLPRYTKENIEQSRDSRRARELSRRARTRQRCFVFDRAYRRVGAFVLRACALWFPAALHGAAARQSVASTTLVNRYRSLSGNRPVFKNESARALLKILRDAGTVGILADQNTMPEEGVFVDFFGMPACTTTGLARVALHTDAAVVPGTRIGIRASENIDCDSNRQSN